MATLDQLALSQSKSTSRSHSTSKSTSTPISIEIAIPENEDTDDTTNNYLHTHNTNNSLHSLQSLQSYNSSSSTPGITPINDILNEYTNNNSNKNIKKLKLKKRSSSVKTNTTTKNNKYYRDLQHSNIEIHAKRKYKLDDGRVGICQFIGQTSFAKGIWVGIVLLNGQNGNTNGTVYGKKYFHCRDGKGLFVRPNKIVKALGRSSIATKPKKKRNMSHKKSISVCSNTSLTMSISSPLHFSENSPNFNVFDNESEFMVHMSSNLEQPKLNNKSKSAQKPSKKSKKTTKKYKSKILREKQLKNDLPQAKLMNRKSDQPPPITTDTFINIKKYKSPVHSPFTPLTPMTPPMLDNSIGSRSAGGSPYASQTNTPIFNGINSPAVDVKFADIPIISVGKGVIGSPLCIGNNNRLSYSAGEPVDALSALRKYFSEECSGQLKYNSENLWGSGSDDSDGAQSDSMLDDEDWVNKQHRARQASLAQTFADALTIPALHPVQQKVAYYIGNKEKWKPPKYDIKPDHSNILNEKLLHHKKHLDEYINEGRKVPKKLGPTDIGTVHGYKIPKYEIHKNEELNNSFKPNGTFLDKDKGWYPKPNKVNKNNNKKKDKHVKSQSLDYKTQKTQKIVSNSNKNNNTKNKNDKIIHGIKKMSFDEEKETNKYEYKKNNNKTDKSKSPTSEHQRSQSELISSNKNKKIKKQNKNNNNNKKKKKRKADDPEWQEDQLTWVPKNSTTKPKQRKLGPRDIGRSDYKGINQNDTKKSKNKHKKKKSRKSRIWVNNKIKRKSANNLNKKSNNKNNLPYRISLPPLKTDKKTKKMALMPAPYVDTPQSTISSGTMISVSTQDSLSPYPYFITDMKLTPNSNISGMSITPFQDFMNMSIVEDDEEDEQQRKSAIVPLFEENYENNNNKNNNNNNSDHSPNSMPFIVDIAFKMNGINNNNLESDSNKPSSVRSGSSVHSLFMTDYNDKVILEDSDMEFAENNDEEIPNKKPKMQNKPTSYTKNEIESIKKQPNKKKNKSSKQRSRSLFSGSSDSKQKLKQQKAAKEKYKEINKAKKYVQNVNNKSKFDRKKRKNKSDNDKKRNAKGSKKKKKNKIWKKGNIKNPSV